MAESRVLYAQHALLPEGWARNTAVAIADSGTIDSVRSNLGDAPPGAETTAGALVPGIPNCHSHAFQRAMAGLTETRQGEDNFWSWREVMYGLLQSIGPDELGVVATQLYIDMLKRGYTGVAEFHYLHHDRNGKPYADPAEMSRRVLDAAQMAGIQLTLLPVLYCHSDFGGKPATEGQRRFVHSVNDYLALYHALAADIRNMPGARLGVAPHSLRAVTGDELEAVLSSVGETVPVHIHIAEQEREVEACLATTGQRPVAWLLDHFEVSPHWCLVHATHMEAAETKALAATGAVAGLCPTTEANLGDGLFPAVDYLGHGGQFAVGSDSQVCLDPAQELRLLEYGQRLTYQRRNLLARPGRSSNGGSLLRDAWNGGARALGVETGAIRPGARADLLVLDEDHPGLAGRSGDALLDSWIFACDVSPVRDVMVGGLWQVHDGSHPLEAELSEHFRAVMAGLSQTVGIP